MPEQIKARVLVIDDEEALRIAVKRILELEGFFVGVAMNGTEGIKKISEEDYDLAVIDLKMPDMSGLDVLKEIRRMRPNTVCLMATAYASYETAVEATKIGADGYILKPFTPEELQQHLTIALEKRRFLVETERLRLEREQSLLEVAVERTRLKTIINSIHDGVLVINRRGELAYFNQAVLRLLDIDYIPIGIPVIEHLPKEISSIISEQYLDVEQQDKSYSVEVEIKPEHQLVIQADLSPVTHPDGSLAGVVVVLANITEFKKLEFLKSQFVSMVAHELKAPIAATLGFIDILDNPTLKVSDEQKTDFLKRSHFRLNSLLLMINDLLDISRMEMNKVPREIKELCVESLFTDIVELFKVDIDKKHLQLQLPSEDSKHLIRGDQNELMRLFTNLFSNAIKYNKENGSITVTVEARDFNVAVIIRDTGIGLRPEEKNKLFREFFRAKNEFTKNIHGTGLGLSIVKRIVEAYGGKIECESTYGTGTTFTLLFPVIDKVFEKEQE
jgi:signal transduction histidine kinase/CheY-like chemotaxis protein